MLHPSPYYLEARLPYLEAGLPYLEDLLPYLEDLLPFYVEAVYLKAVFLLTTAYDAIC